MNEDVFCCLKTVLSTNQDFRVRFLNSGSYSADPNREPEACLVFQDWDMDWRKGVEFKAWINTCSHLQQF